MTFATLRKRTGAVSLLSAMALLMPSIAFADPQPAGPTTAPTTTPAPATTSSDSLAEARRRYDRALELSDEGNYEEALLELQKAYSLAPTYRLLYNLGVVSVAVHDYVKAVDYFSRYLQQGSAEIDPARVSEVKSQLERLKVRISSIRVRVNIPGADISIDDVSIGKSPLDTYVSVNAGRHRVTATSDGYFPSAVVVEIAGNERREVALTMTRGAAENSPQVPSRKIPWLAWGITGALAAGTVVTGVLALKSSNDYDTAVNTLGVSGSDVNSDYRKMRVFSVSSDVLLVSSIVVAGLSLYLTLKAPRQTKERAALVHLSPSGLAF